MEHKPERDFKLFKNHLFVEKVSIVLKILDIADTKRDLPCSF